jgi:large subunit ribosomal protein L4
LQVPVYNNAGKVVSQLEVDEYIFGVQPNKAVVHQALLRQRANARQGTADTKTRREVAGGSRKLYRQKHTGMARSGTRRSPLRRGGGIIFGPHPRSYRQDMPKKMRRLALRSVISAKLAEGELRVLDSFGLEQPDTKQILHIFKALGVNPPALVVNAGVDTNVVKSTRNIEGVKTLPADMLNTVDLLSYSVLLMTVDAVRQVESVWGKQRAVAGAKGT